MKEEFQRPALEILLKIYSSEEERISKELIVEEVGEETEEFLDFMHKIDLLETENDPDVYFLTTMAYELLEKQTLEDYLYGVFYKHELEEEKEENDEGFPLIFDLEAVARPGGRSIYSTILLFALIMALVMIVSNGIRPSKQDTDDYPELTEEAKKAILDSIHEMESVGN
jgi:hypothetical protein